MCFNASRFAESTITALPELDGHVSQDHVTWFDHDDAPDAPMLQKFQSMLSLHPLAIADVANVPQRPKLESYDGFDFVVLKMLSALPDAAGIESEQVSLFVGPSWVVSFQERPGDCLGPVRDRLRAGSGQIRSMGADYLAYAIVDAVVDGYFPVVEGLGDRLDSLEVEILGSDARGVVRRLHAVRRDLLVVRKAIWPLREALAQMTRDVPTRFTPATKLFIRDAYDHTIQLIDLVENLRELASSLLELHLASVGFRTNEVMKVLTIISTIFLPLTFIAGVYGMNFDTTHPWNMPELAWRYGYVFSLALMGGSAVAMLAFFRAKGWLGRRQKTLLDDDKDAKS